MKKSGVLLLVLLLTLVAASPAAADQPTTYQASSQGDYQPLVDCRPLGYDFEIWDHWVSTDTVTVFADNVAHTERMSIQRKYTDNFYRPDLPDIILSGSGTGRYQIELLSQDPLLYQLRVVGVGFDIQLPGEPKLVHVSGPITVATDAAGNWLEVLKVVGHPRWDIPGLCEYFAAG
jgi:hypothetical protein